MRNAFLFSVVLSSAIVAAPSPASDSRIVSRFYDSGAVVAIVGRTGVQSAIEFAPDERIENIAVGNSAAWQVTPNKRANLLFLKPMTATAKSNMTVITDQRTYLFDLTTASKAAPVYVMRFTYPKSPAKPAPVAVVEAQKPPAAAATPADLNFAWAAKGSKHLVPTRMFDDGRATYLAWPQEVALPAVLALDAHGTEGPVNYRVEGSYLVVDGVPSLLVLRSGREVATLTPLPRAAGKDAPPPKPNSASATLASAQ
jgi:type IV secretion system protein VirB9